MAFMILLFSVLPCADSAAFEMGDAKYNVAQSLPQDTNQHYQDACSPFCICSCCAGFSINSIANHSSAFLAYYKINHSSFILAPTFSIASSIWQPPQLV